MTDAPFLRSVFWHKWSDKLKLFYMWEGETIMVSKKFVIENEQGLHKRPAGVLAKAVTKFESDVTIVFEDKKINAKSLLNIIFFVFFYRAFLW